MITLKSLTVQNFWSFGQKPQTLDLNKNMTSMIIGYNRDKGDSGSSRNGVGKSGIFQAIIYCLFGEGMDKIKADNFINFTNKKKMEVRLALEKNGSEFEIVRGRKPNKVEVYKDGHEYTKDSVRNTDELIEEVIGMNFDIFINTCLLNPHTEPFMNMKGAEQRDFMENLLSLDLLTKRAETLKGMRNDCRSEIKVLENELETARKQNEKVHAQIESIQYKQKEWEDKKFLKLEQLHGDLAKIDNQISQSDEDLKLNDELDELTRQYDEQREHANQLQKTIQELHNKVRDLDRLIDQADDIPSEEDIKEKIEGFKERTKESIRDIANVDYDRVMKIHHDYIEPLQEESEAIEKRLNDLEKEFGRAETDHGKAKEELEKIESGVCPRCNQAWHDNDEKERLEEQLLSLKAGMEDIKRDFEEQDNRLDEIGQQIKAYHEEIREITGSDMSPAQASQYKTKREGMEDQLSHMDAQRDQEIEEANRKMADIEQKIIDATSAPDIDTAMNEYDRIHEELKETKEQANQQEEHVEEIREKVDYMKSRLRKGEFMSRDQINGLQADRKRIVESIDEWNAAENPHDGQLKDMEGMYQSEDEKPLKDLQNREEHYTVLIKLLTDNKSYIRKNIINQYVPYLNRQINQYLDHLDSQHMVEISPDLTVDVYYLNESVSYGNMSRGERLRLNLGTSLAFRDLNGLLGKNTNLLMIDEYLDSALDPAGFQQVFSLIKGYADHTMIISHRDDLLPLVDEIITVEKINAFTVIDKAA